MKINRSKSIDTTAMSREEWLAARREGIGGSDAATIMGASKFSSPLGLYMDKIGEGKNEDEASEAARLGTYLEQYVADRFEEETGKKLRKCNRILIHPKYEWMRANIDREVVGEEAGFEAKTTSMMNPTDFDAGEVQANYYWQCQHYMAVTGAPRWYLGVVVLSKGFHVFCIERDKDAIELLIIAEKEFWQNVQDRIPPLPIGTDVDEVMMEQMYDNLEDNELPPERPDLLDDLNRLELLKADIKARQKQVDILEQGIQQQMGEAGTERITSGQWRVSWKLSSRTSIDSKRLRAEHPDIAEQYSKTTESRTFRVSKAKSKKED